MERGEKEAGKGRRGEGTSWLLKSFHSQRICSLPQTDNGFKRQGTVKGLWEHFSRSWHHKVCSKFQRSFSTTSLSLDGPVQERVHHPHRNFHWSLLEFLQGCSWRWRMALWWQVE